MPHRRHVHSSMVPRDTITPTDSNLQKVKFDIQHDVAFHESFGILQLRFQVDSSALEDRCLCWTIPCNHSEILRPARERLLTFLFEPWRGKCLMQLNLRPTLWHLMASYGPRMKFTAISTFAEEVTVVRSHPQCKVWLRASCKGDARHTVWICMDQMATGSFCS